MTSQIKRAVAGDPAAEKVLKFIQVNMNKAGLAAISLNERLKSIKGDFVSHSILKEKWQVYQVMLKYYQKTLKKKQAEQ